MNEILNSTDMLGRLLVSHRQQTEQPAKLTMKEIREQLQEKLDAIRADNPQLAMEIWNLFKAMKTPEKVVETVTVKDESREKELEQEVNRLQNKLAGKETQIKDVQDELNRVNEMWKERTTIYVDKIHAGLNHPFLDPKLTDKQLNELFADQTWALVNILDKTVIGLRNMSFARKKMLLHIGFSEFHFFKTLAGSEREAMRNCFAFEVKLVKKGEKCQETKNESEPILRKPSSYGTVIGA
jgi:hypothetical protein